MIISKETRQKIEHLAKFNNLSMKCYYRNLGGHERSAGAAIQSHPLRYIFTQWMGVRRRVMKETLVVSCQL